MNKKYNFTIEQILEMISLYDARVPIKTIAKLYGLNYVTLWILLKKYETLNLIKFRSISETVLTTLSKKRTIPKGEKNNRVKGWKRKFGREGLIDILTIFLVTDASADHTHKIIRLVNSDDTFLKIFTDLLNELDLEPRKTTDTRNGLNIIFSRNKKVKSVLDEVHKRTPTTKHQPRRGKETWKEYSMTKQPSISFLYTKPIELIQLCFRIGMSLEGCVMAEKYKNRITRPTLHFTCFNQNLLKEWKKISEITEINMGTSTNVLRTRSLISANKFLEFGGFIEGVKNSSKSRYYEGIEKNEILKKLLEDYNKIKREK